MIEHVLTLLAETPSLTVEADLTDWAEQHHTVTHAGCSDRADLPDDPAHSKCTIGEFAAPSGA
jgi:hypothetical protein